MKTKLAFVLVLLASGCAPELEENHKQIVRNVLDASELLICDELLEYPEEGPNRLAAFVQAGSHLEEVPMSPDWRKELALSCKAMEHKARMLQVVARRFQREEDDIPIARFESLEGMGRRIQAATAISNPHRDKLTACMLAAKAANTELKNLCEKFLAQNGGGQP
jgi:DNA repair ATPase RecN